MCNMEVHNFLKPQESLEDLMIGDLKLIQKKSGFRFGTDAVLLSDFAKDIASNMTLDLCTGSGIVPILLSHKSNAKKIFGLEIQEDIHEMSKRSVKINILQGKVELKKGDLKEITKHFPKRTFSLVTANPPYMKSGSGISSADYGKYISRHEALCTLEDVISAAESMLSVGGHFVMVHRPSRLTDILSLMRKYKIEPKRLRFVLPKINEEPSLILIDGLLRGGEELKILPPLVLYDENGIETDELKRIYERR